MINTIRSSIKLSVIIVVALLASACGQSEQAVYQPTASPLTASLTTEYVVGFLPQHNPQRLMQMYGPIVDYMNRNIPEAHFKFEASSSFEEFEKKIYSGHYAFAMANPYQTVLALKHGYRVFGKMGDDNDFRGLIVVRKDSGIGKVADLKGKAVSFPAKTALAASMLPQYYLQTHGIDVNRDIEIRHGGSMESSIMNVYLGHVAAAATWPPPWRLFSAEHPDMASQLVVKWQTQSLVNNGWIVRNDISVPMVENVSRLLFHLHESAEGRKILERLPVSRFEPATEATYRPVREFLKEFSRTVHQIEQ